MVITASLSDSDFEVPVPVQLLPRLRCPLVVQFARSPSCYMPGSHPTTSENNSSSFSSHSFISSLSVRTLLSFMTRFLVMECRLGLLFLLLTYPRLRAIQYMIGFSKR